MIPEHAGRNMSRTSSGDPSAPRLALHQSRCSSWDRSQQVSYAVGTCSHACFLSTGGNLQCFLPISEMEIFRMVRYVRPLPGTIFRTTSACSNGRLVIEDLIKPTARSCRQRVSPILRFPIREIAKNQRTRPPEWFGVALIHADVTIIFAASSMRTCRHFAGTV